MLLRRRVHRDKILLINNDKWVYEISEDQPNRMILFYLDGNTHGKVIGFSDIFYNFKGMNQGVSINRDDMKMDQFYYLNE